VTGGFSMRPATPADRPDLVRVLLSSRRAFLPYAPLAHDEADIEHWMEGLLTRDGVTAACSGQRVVGFLAVDSASDAHWIAQLYLAPGYTGMGIGGRLLAHAIDLLSRRLPIRLYTFQANAGARRFYERAGFVPVAFSDGAGNEEHCPDVLYELEALPPTAP
jgi:GNAT superfamily N-acetyltransferase